MDAEDRAVLAEILKLLAKAVVEERDPSPLSSEEASLLKQLLARFQMQYPDK